MAAFSKYLEIDFSKNSEIDGISMQKENIQLQDVFEYVMKNCNTDYIYWSVLVKNYFGKNIEIKITDIAKDKEYRERGVAK